VNAQDERGVGKLLVDADFTTRQGLMDVTGHNAQPMRRTSAAPHRNDRRLAIRPLRGGNYPPLDRPTSDVTAGEGMERLLSVDDAAEVLGTSARFPRRLIAERRIRFVRVGRHVRIPESAIAEYIEARTVPALAPRRAGRVA